MTASDLAATPVVYADAQTPLIRNCWYVVALLGDFTRELQERYVLGQSVLIFQNTEGHPVVMQNRCAHRSFPLHHGRLEGDEVVCMYHGLRYNAAGACVHAPMIKRAAPHVSVRSYPTVVHGPLVWIWTGEPALSDERLIPDTQWLTSDGWTHRVGHVRMKANYVGLHENLLDLTHFSYLHAGNIGTPEWAECPLDVTAEGDRVHTVRRLNDAAPPAMYVAAMKLDEKKHVNRVADSWFMSPGMFIATSSIEVLNSGPGGQRHYHLNILHIITPETQNSLTNWAFIGHDFALDDSQVGDALIASALKAFDEDRNALEWIHEINQGEGWPESREASFASDRGGMAMRRILQRLAHAEQASSTLAQQ